MDVRNPTTSTSGGLSPYLGFASVAGVISDTVASSGSAVQRKWRKMDIARNRMRRPRALLNVGWFVNSSGVEVTQAGSYQIQAAIEYPIGTYRRVAINGQMTATVNGGTTISTDDPGVDIVIPDGAIFAWQFWEASPNGYLYHNNGPAIAGDDVVLSVGGTVPDLDAAPLAVGSAAPGAVCHTYLGTIDTITKAADLDISDSLGQGSGTDQRDISGILGLLARMTRGKFGGLNACRSSTRANQFTAANRPLTISLAQYASRIKCGFGVNDCLNSVAAATTVTELVRIRNLFPDKQFFQTTIVPIVTGTTVAQDGSDQTVGTPGTIATTLNTAIRAGLVVASGGKTPAPTITGVLDVRNVVQHPLNEEKWNQGFTGDAADPRVHPIGRVYRLIGESCPGREALY